MFFLFFIVVIIANGLVVLKMILDDFENAEVYLLVILEQYIDCTTKTETSVVVREGSTEWHSNWQDMKE